MADHEIVIPYEPRKAWRDELHPALEKYRFAVIVAHRRFGKTVGMVMTLIKAAIQNELLSPQYAYIGPFRNQAKMVAWNYLKYYTSVIPGRKVNETELFVELPSQHTNAVGARIYIVGADHPDALRGTYWDGVVLDEFAQIKPELWGEVMRPALADRKGFAYFIGTPKGQNQFYDMYLKAQKDPDWYCYCSRADESGVLDPEEVAAMKRDMTDIEIRQELYCDFTASATDVVIPIDMVTAAAERLLRPDEVKGMPVILGVDVARFGDDRTVIFRRQGLQVFKPLIFRGLNTIEVADRVLAAIGRWNPDVTFVDAGAMGAGVIDQLRARGAQNVVEVNFGGQALEPERYANLRAEMYFKLRDWFTAGGAIPPDEAELKSELTITQFQFTRQGKIILQPKEEIKALTGKSPDLADGLALTFARPVLAKAVRRMERTADMAYSFY
nr:MAG TPA: Large subunit terminase [Caudoviricetes sp.]